VKFVGARAGDGRGQMRERQRRDRAATQSLRVRYPQFHSVRLDFDFSDDGKFTPAPQVTVLHPPATAYFIFPCPYPDCDGEFNLAPVIDEMANGASTHGEGQMRCSGHRTGANETRLSCGLTLEYRVQAQKA
jgi:hypothetical protein